MTRTLRPAAALMGVLLGVGAMAGSTYSAETSSQLASQPVPSPVDEAPSRPDADQRAARATLPPSRASYLPIILREAAANDLPAAIADAVVRVESAYDPAAVGSVGEIGLMQIRPSTAAMIGFRGTLAELADPETNIRYGVSYLAQAWRLAKGDLCRTLMKYRAGHGAEQMSPLSSEYCRKARLHLDVAWADFSKQLDLEPVPAPALKAAGRESTKPPAARAVRTAGRSAAQPPAPRSGHSLIAASRAQSDEAWTRASGRARSQAFWAAHEAHKISLRRQLMSTSIM